jgi:translation initiation factor IF-3
MNVSTEPRINERIRVPEVRLVGPSGEQVGIVSIADALRLAQESDLDLVEVAPTARPPVCKLMDYGKFKYESALKARESRKNQTQTVIKEIKIRPKIDPHDYGTKRGHVERFLRQGDKVKVTIMFRGREQSRPELGYKLLQRLAIDVEELGFVESQPKQDGRNMIMVIGPHRKKSESRTARGTERASARAAAPMGHQGQDVPRLPAAAVGATDRPAAPRPASMPPRPAPAASTPPASAPAPSAPAAERQATAPRPTAPAARPDAPRPVAPKPGPVTARPTAPRPTAPRPVAPRPAAPRPAPPRSAPQRTAAKPGESHPVPTTRGKPAGEGTTAEPGT